MESCHKAYPTPTFFSRAVQSRKQEGGVEHGRWCEDWVQDTQPVDPGGQPNITAALCAELVDGLDHVRLAVPL